VLTINQHIQQQPLCHVAYIVDTSLCDKLIQVNQEHNFFQFIISS
jgi:hypothetical protein